MGMTGDEGSSSAASAVVSSGLEVERRCGPRARRVELPRAAQPRLGERLGGDVGERRAAPQREGLARLPARLRAARSARHRSRPPRGGACSPGRGSRSGRRRARCEARGHAPGARWRAGRRPLAPDPVDQPVGRDQPRWDGAAGAQAARAVSGHRAPPAGRPHRYLHRAEQAELHVQPPSRRAPSQGRPLAPGGARSHARAPPRGPRAAPRRSAITRACRSASWACGVTPIRLSSHDSSDQQPPRPRGARWRARVRRRRRARSRELEEPDLRQRP